MEPFDRDATLEADAVGLGHGVAVLVLGDIQPLLFDQPTCQVGGAADLAGLAHLADRALEQRLDEDLAVMADRVLDLVFAGVRAKHLGDGEVDVLQQGRAVQHSGELHDVSCPGSEHRGGSRSA